MGGIPVKEHFEVNVAPIQIQMTYQLYKAVMQFFFPDKNIETDDGELGSIWILFQVLICDEFTVHEIRLQNIKFVFARTWLCTDNTNYKFWLQSQKLEIQIPGSRLNMCSYILTYV